MLAILNNEKLKPLLICDGCGGQISNYPKASVIINGDDLVVKVKLNHERCIRADEVKKILPLNKYIIDLLK